MNGTRTMRTTNDTTDKLIRIQDELQKLKLWNAETPNWVSQFPEKDLITQTDFIHWLQFIFLPNKMNEIKKGAISLVNTNIALQANKFLGSHEKYQRLINLLIELDSLSA